MTPVTIDYAHDVLPLTPSGNATERHMLAAYIQAASTHFPNNEQRIAFWSGKLGLSTEQTAAAIADYAKFSNLVRARLMKKGGVGYVPPSPDSFPTVDECNRLTLACEALPCAAWLDGISSGEQAIGELLDLLVGKGAAALNIVPDRNWNLADPDVKRLKLAKLYEVARIAADLDLPLNIGTEMNSPGNRLVDDFAAPELAPVRQAFLDGAYFIYGHTALQRAAGLGYQSAWAKALLPTRKERNAFYTEAGKLIPPGRAAFSLLQSLASTAHPADILKHLAIA
jgi:hypothetical protein